MKESERGGEESIKQVESKRARKGKLERVSRSTTERKNVTEALRKAEEEKNTILNTISELVAYQDMKHRLLWANRAAAESVGLAVEDLVGRCCYEIWHGRRKPCAGCPVEKAWKSGQLETGEVVGTDGRVWSLRVYPVKDIKGNIKGAVEVTRDITERKRAQEALRESEARFRSLYDNALVGLYRTTPDGRILMANPALVRMLGYSSFNELKQRNLEEEGFGAEYPRSVFKECIEANGKVISLESAWQTHDGKTLFVLESAQAFRDKAGNTLYYEGTIQDITERKRAAEALQLERDNLIGILGAMKDGVYIVNQENDIEYVNPVLQKDFGRWQGRKCYEYFHDRKAVCPWCKNKEVFAGKTVRWEWYSFKNQRTYDLVDTPLKNPDGSMSKLEIFHDITERKRAEEALKESEGRYKALFKGAPDGIIVADVETGQYIHVNPSICKRLGYSEEEIKGLSQFRGIHPKGETDRIKRLFFMQAREEIDIAEDIPFVKKDGTIRYFDVNSVSVEIDGIQRVIGLLRDITERKRAEGALRDSEEHYRMLAERMNEGLVQIDKDGRYVYVNRKHGEMFGYSPDEMVGRHWAEFHDIDAQKIIKKEMARRKKGLAEPYEVAATRKDGRRIHIRVSPRPIYDKDGKFKGSIAILTDITERKKVEDLLKKSEENYRTLVEAIPYGIQEIDTAGIITYCNPAYQKILGYTKKELLGKSIIELLEPASRRKELHGYLSILVKDQPEPTIYLQQNRTKDGRIVDMEVAWNYKWDNENCVVGFRSVITDITERKKAEEEVLMDRAQLKSLASQLTLAEERERRRIASEIHDVTIQSLSLAKMKLDGLGHSVSSRDPAEVLDEVRGALGKAIDETRSLVSRVHSPILALLGFEAAVGEWLTGQIQEKHGIECRFEDDGQPKPLDDDIELVLFRDVRELLMNVVKHARTKKVKVSIGRDGEQICVIVEDDGVGFDPAEAVSMAYKRDEFGLFSIRERLEELGGAFEIESAPGRGCRAVMRAPLKCGTQIEGDT